MEAESYDMGGYQADVLFYATAWSLASVTALLVTFRDRRYRNLWDLLATAALAGFVAVAVLGLAVNDDRDITGNEYYYLGVAVTIGLLGEASLQIPKRITDYVLKRYTNTNAEVPRSGGAGSADENSDTD